jgi:hypothetical protein
MVCDIVINPHLLSDRQIAQRLDFLKTVLPGLFEVVTAAVRHILRLQHCGAVEYVTPMKMTSSSG